MTFRIITIATTSLFIVACANTQPIIDSKGVDMREYEADLSECQQYAKQVETSKETATDTGLGAMFGWAVSKAAGGDAKQGAAIGAVTGGSKGLRDSARTKEQVIRRCLQGRGYKVLG